MPNNIFRTDAAAGSRETIARDLARRERRREQRAQDFADAESVTRQDVIAAIRDAEDHVIAEIVATGASLQEFGEALNWMCDDENAWDAGMRPPSGRVGRLVDLLRAAEDTRTGSAGDDR